MVQHDVPRLTRALPASPIIHCRVHFFNESRQLWRYFGNFKDCLVYFHSSETTRSRCLFRLVALTTITYHLHGLFKCKNLTTNITGGPVVHILEHVQIHVRAGISVIYVLELSDQLHSEKGPIYF